MSIPIPTTAVDAGQLLAELAVQPHLVPCPPAQDEDTLWQTLTRRVPGDLGARFAERQRAWLEREADGTSVRLELPPALWGWPYAEGCRRFLANPGIRSDHLAPRVALSAARARLSVLAPVTGVLPCPEGSWALTVTALACQQTADALLTWAPSLARRDADKARAESAFYREHAAAAESQLQASWDWLTDVPEPTRAAEETLTIPVQIRLGAT